MMTIDKISKKIRKARHSELDEIARIANKTFDSFYRSFLSDHNVNWYVNSGELKREIVKHANDLYVLLADNIITGFIIYFNDFIHIMMIDTNAHRSGMGSYLLNAVEEELFKDHDHIKLQSFAGNDIATNFYLKNGWTKGQLNNAQSDVAMMYFEKSKNYSTTKSK